MEAEGNPTGNPAGSVRRPRRLWLWFAGGFLLVFVGTLLLVTMTAMHPSGQYTVRYPLWQYYGIMVPRLFGSSTFGPASGGTSALLETAVFHLLFSTAGGCVAAGVGWRLSRFQHRRAAAQGTSPEG